MSEMMSEVNCTSEEQEQLPTGITLTGLSRRVVQCIGPWFLAYFQGKHDIESDSCDQAQEEDSPNATLFDEDDVEYLRSLDPKEWKFQDHYAVLGLSKLRYKATEEDIKKAYRMKVLLHHPDKRKGMGEEIRPDDDYFTCITKAYEILGNPRTRRSYDSVDPNFDDSIPSLNDHTKSNFYEVFGKTFSLNSRWSEKKPVPQLGGPDSPREAVDRFYQFWYNFESWREYSYLDEEEKEKGQVREERKWIDKQNKIVRLKRKKEEMARIRTLVDNAYALDPRIAKFKQELKDRKLAAKQAKKDAIRARQAEEEKKQQEAEEEERRKKAELEAAEKAKLNALKAEREVQRKALKAKRTSLRKLVKSKDYFIEKEDERVRHMAALEKLCEVLQPNELEQLVGVLSVEGRKAYESAMEDIEKRIEEERQAQINAAMRTSNSGGQSMKKGGLANWTSEQLQLLIKAVNIFPAGTNQRWEVVANFINHHDTSSSSQRTAKDVLSKAKDLQSSDYTRNILKESANKKAYDTFEKERSVVDLSASASQRFDTPAEQQGMIPWTAAEQQLLEQALKTYPASTPERWDKIAACLPTRNKKECMRRFKELAEMVKAKKAAQAAATVAQKKK